MSSLSWIPPDGHDTGVVFYNSASKSKVPFKTIYPGLTSWYMCGPTVYDSAHIGHALSYVKFDIIRRILARVFNINVVVVMGVTDIDDKIIKRAHEMKVDFRELSKFYEEEFFADMDRLRVLRPSLAPRVTEHVPFIVAFIQKILDNKLAYSVSDGSVYFDTVAFGRYGKMTPLDGSVDAKESGIKKSPRDFALWKGAKPGEPYWESPWGRGRPGWHIECSAMANHILGTRLDLHSGGIDLLFPHHENEEAQCCAHSGDLQWCNYWLHTEVAYTQTCMLEASAHVRRVRAFLQDAYAYINGQLKCGPLDESGLKQRLAQTRVKVKNHLADDMDTSKALSAVMDLISHATKELHTKPTSISLSRSAGTMVAICSYIHYLMEDVFGMSFPSLRDAANMSLESSGRLAHVMNSVVKFRHEVRSYALLQDPTTAQQELSSADKKLKRKERVPLLQACDNLRENLQMTGLSIKDHNESSTWSVSDGTVGSSEKAKKKN
ncbi:probable cysteine--tRNA ligase, mitochondrial isoform X2 [Macrobrachium nipponense]|uniref:probable cysteine--tRNA ligase, mitochondrial isoform X2 n=1 Tax=Macrobrachium nipponense TaxID=159736 RepID=UPI0030C7AF3E